MLLVIRLEVIDFDNIFYFWLACHGGNHKFSWAPSIALIISHNGYFGIWCDQTPSYNDVFIIRGGLNYILSIETLVIVDVRNYINLILHSVNRCVRR